VNARPYPEGFFTWDENERNAYFANAAAAYREKNAVEAARPARLKVVDADIAPPPLSPNDSGPLESQEVLTRPERARFRLLAFNDIKLDDGGMYLIKGLLPRVGLAVVWGAPKCGKSFWTFDALMHVALGWEYRGHRVAPGPVVYCALEGVQGFRNRIEAFRQAKLSEADCGSPQFYLVAASLSLVADHQALIGDIRRQLGDRSPVAICLDTLNRSLAGSESSDEDMAAYIRAADAIRDALDCLVLIVHHCGHDGSRPRGHSSLMGALDVQIAVSRNATGNIVAELELTKDGEVGLQFVSRLVQRDIAFDQDGDAITSCVVDAVEGACPARKGRSPPRSAQAALRALQTAIDEVGERAPVSNTIPSSVRVVPNDTWRRYCYQSGISDSDEPEARKKAFSRAHKLLVDGNHVQAHNEYRWISE
jgi:AAA domain